jgi:hypothetical protein
MLKQEKNEPNASPSMSELPSKPGSASSTSVRVLFEEVKASVSGITVLLLAASYHCQKS